MYYPDLSQYEYWSHDPGINVRSIGWLDSHHHYQSGPVPGLFLEKLQLCYQRPVFLSFGYHTCDFCGETKDVTVNILGKPWKPGSAEIRVIGNGVIYASPDMLYHYIVEHQYQPPDEFIQAVIEQVPPNQNPEFNKIYSQFG